MNKVCLKLWSAAGAVVLSTVLSGCTGAPSPSPSRSPSPTTDGAAPASGAATAADGLQGEFESTISKVLPSVVLIQTSRDLGSGVVFDDQGDVVTNDHVVGTATSFKVTLTGSTQPLSATLVGTYPADDLAVIRVAGAKGLHPAAFADSSKVQIGQIVLAMGNPLGLAGSVTNGIVSAVDRTVSEPSGGGSPGATLPQTIQTSAAINPGNSGGGLVDLAGQVIGIPTLAATDPQLGGGAAPGIGFAIASNIVKDVASQIVAHGKVVTSHRAALEIRTGTVTDSNGQPAGSGIAAVNPGGAADKAGLQTGDVITAVNGTPTPTVQALSAVLANLQPGQPVPLDVRHPDGTSKTVNVTLGTLPG